MFDSDDHLSALDESSQFRQVLDRHPLAKNSAYWGLLNAVAHEAKKADPKDQYWRLNQGLEVVDEIMRAVNENAWEEDPEAAKTRKLWYHQPCVRLAGKKRLEPYIRLHDVEQAAASYLRLPYRVPALDRLLADMLIAAEMYAFADEVQPVLNKKLPLILGWLLNNAFGLVAGCSLAAFIIWIGNDRTVTDWIGVIVLGLTLLGTIWSLVAFPFFYPKLRSHYKRTEDIISAMLDAYLALGGSPASAKHVDERIAKATDAGAVWPAQLIVLMEDIRARTQTI